MIKTPSLVVIILLICSTLGFAGVSGKITGIVTDGESGMPLPGVNVSIENSTLGAASDIEGKYVILNVPPGTYTLKYTMMGYAEQKVQKVRVILDQTTNINTQLRSVVLVGEEVVVVAERPVVTKDVSNSQMNIVAETIETMPIETVKEVLTLQAGIQRGSEGILVRGGGANQTTFNVDGLSQNDERANIPYTAVSLSSIQEIQLQTGGFNAEYGNVRSGLVNVVTKEGSRTRYHGTAMARYSPAKPKNFGPSIYDPFSYFNRPYMDPAVCYTGTNNGAWDSYTKSQYQNFEGWNSVSAALLSDDDPTNDLTPEGAKRLYEWQHRRQGNIEKPDYVADIGFGGPVPLISSKLGNLRFFLSYFKEKDMFVFPLSRDNYGENHTQLKLTSDISPSMKLTISGLYGEIHSVSPYSWTTAPTGRILRTPGEIADLINSSSGNAMLYMPGYYSPSSIYRNVIGIKFSHVLSSKTFYEISFQNKISRYNTYKMSDRDTTKSFQPVPGYFVDESPYGYMGYGVNGIDGMIMGGWMNLGRDKSVNSTTSLGFDIVSQVNFNHQIKAGLDFVYNDYNIDTGTYSPSMSTWTRSQVYNIFPFRLGAYLQDKIEFQGFIANVGLRLDYSDPNTDWFELENYDKNYTAGYGNSLETNIEKQKANAKLYISPRLGVSHPITENSKLYFNYGHFRSEASSTYRFRLQRESNGLVTSIGNPNLELEKTVSYELGYAHSLFDKYLINLAAYYKDVTNQAGWIYYQDFTSSVQYNKSANNNYADIRGFELTLTKRMGSWITGFINYTYDVSTSGYFGLRRYYEDRIAQRDYLRLNPYQSKPRPRPYARANLDVHTPSSFGPSWLGFLPLSSWNFNILAEWRTGGFYTYNPKQIPGVIDDTQWKDWYNFDLRISKLFKIRNYELQLYIDMRNAFNTKILNYAGFSDNFDWFNYLESLNFSWEEGAEKGNDRIGEFRPDNVAYDPLEPNPNNDSAIKSRNDKRKENKSYIDMPNIRAFTFLNPRDITFGFRINF